MNRYPVPETRIQPVWMALLKSAGFVLLFEAAQVLQSLVIQFICLIRISGLATMSPSQLEEAFYQQFYSVLYEIMFLAAGLFLLITALIYLFRQDGFTNATGLRGASPLGCVAAVFLGFGAFFLAGVLVQMTSLIPAVQESAETYSEQMEEIESAIENQGRPWVDLLYTVAGAPIVEEVLCRGLVLRQLRRATSGWVAIFLSAACFALIHGNIFQGIFTFPLGVLLGYLAVKFDSVLPSILLHAAFNGSYYLPYLGQYLGLPEDSAYHELFFNAAYGLYCFAIPIGVCLLYLAVQGKPRVTTRAPKKIPAPVVPVRHDLRGPAYDWQRPVTPAIPAETEGQNMAAPEYLIVGLGNPGAKYASTRHNAGFIALDYLALRERADVTRLRFKGLTGEREIDGKKVLFLKPQTFMNLSGESVREAASFYHIPPEKILVLVDDVNFEPGALRIRKEGSAGGHNGLKSIIECLGTEAFPRVRLGVGAVPPERDLVGWVLGTLPEKDMDALISTLNSVHQTVRYFLNNDLDGAMNAFNGKSK